MSDADANSFKARLWELAKTMDKHLNYIHCRLSDAQLCLARGEQSDAVSHLMSAGKELDKATCALPYADDLMPDELRPKTRWDKTIAEVGGLEERRAERDRCRNGWREN
jgi:hypothetical protein